MCRGIDAHHVGMASFICNLDIVEPYVQKSASPVVSLSLTNEAQKMNALVHRFQNACDWEIIFELYRDLLVCEGFENREYQLKRIN